MTENKTGAEGSEANQSGPLMRHKQDPDDNEYATPPEIWRPLSRAVGGFDLDPASGSEPQPLAPDRYTESDNGLKQPWHGAVYCNPPWSSNGDGSAKTKWLRKARRETDRSDVDVVLIVLPADTSAHWFHNHALDATALCLVGPGRIPFLGEDRNPAFELCIMAFGAVNNDLLNALNSLGAVIQGRTVYDPKPQQKLDKW